VGLEDSNSTIWVLALSKVIQNRLCGYETVFMAAMQCVVKKGLYPHCGVVRVMPKRM
jgi:hypothetical protein